MGHLPGVAPGAGPTVWERGAACSQAGLWGHHPCSKHLSAVRPVTVDNQLPLICTFPSQKKSLIQQPTNMLSFLVGSSALILEHNTAVYRKQQCTLSSVFTLVILFGKQGFRLLAVVGGSFQSERWALFNAERMVVHWNTPFFVLIAAHLSGIRGGGYHGCILFLHTNLTCL